ncbi:meiosis initiator protein-like [Ornithorhynchus anatinus]|uniref:meiosis initiator protein-like n=1 Tax=Ornithorhynchus anatinus TaxID=9258 RepID=UPI0019D48F8F|nr:meiosis initiator protein-like [Ornithorhynchus anatinus]
MEPEVQGTGGPEMGAPKTCREESHRSRGGQRGGGLGSLKPGPPIYAHTLLFSWHGGLGQLGLGAGGQCSPLASPEPQRATGGSWRCLALGQGPRRSDDPSRELGPERDREGEAAGADTPTGGQEPGPAPHGTEEGSSEGSASISTADDCALSTDGGVEELEDEEDLSPVGPKLVDYDSDWEEEEDEDSSTGPWLSALTPPNSPHGLVVPGSEPPLLLLPARDCCATGCSAQDLGLSPSLFSSPSHLLSGQTQPEGIESVSQALFEDVCLNLSTGTLWTKDPWTSVSDFSSSSEEDGDCVWRPIERDPKPSPARPQTKRAAEPGRRPVAPNPPCPFLLKKKCVNGFIMFCRLNRKQYIRSKARRFSRLHNRIVRSDNSSSDEELPPQKPFYLLLAEKAHCFPPPGTL